jgi:hypothetical protein
VQRGAFAGCLQTDLCLDMICMQVSRHNVDILPLCLLSCIPAYAAYVCGCWLPVFLPLSSCSLHPW